MLDCSLPDHTKVPIMPSSTFLGGCDSSPQCRCGHGISPCCLSQGPGKSHMFLGFSYPFHGLASPSQPASAMSTGPRVVANVLAHAVDGRGDSSLHPPDAFEYGIQPHPTSSTGQWWTLSKAEGGCACRTSSQNAGQRMTQTAP